MAFDVFEHGAAPAVAAAAPEFEAAADAAAAAAAESGPVEMAHCLSVCFEACQCCPGWDRRIADPAVVQLLLRSAQRPLGKALLSGR